METILLSNTPEKIYSVYSENILNEFSLHTKIDTSKCYCKDYITMNPFEFKDTKYILSTWGMPFFSKEEISLYFPSLEHIFYAAGSVQNFARPFMDCSVSVHSAYMANAVPVAEYTVSQIILANKCFFQNTYYQSNGMLNEAISIKKHIKGTYGCNIGIIGAGAIGTKVINMLNESYNVNIFVYDPFLNDNKAELLNVKKVNLHDIFTNCNVISNHLANNEQTKQMIDYDCFSLMGSYTTFINTGRGAQVVENDLIRALIEDSSRCAVLDVTDPEPPVSESKLYKIPNVYLTSHIAGSMGDELYRMSKYMLEEFISTKTDQNFKHLITYSMLKTMA